MIIALFGTLGLPELLVILFIIVMIFGANRLAGLGRGLGKAISGFKDETKAMREEDEENEDEPRARSKHPANG